VGSFRDTEKALHFELTRQQSLAERSITIPAETRHWDEARKITVSSRSKEEEQDYRYFPEEDIPKIIIEKTLLESLKKAMPESVMSKKERYISKYGIPIQVAEVLSSDKFYSDLFEQSHTEKNAKEIANLITTDLKGFADTKEQREQLKLEPKHLSDLADAILSNKITRTSGKTALQEIIKTGKSISEIIASLDLGHVDDEPALVKTIDEIFIEEQKAVSEAKQNPDTINYLMGKVMKKTNGKANPSLTLDIIRKKLESQ
jgi:aspartyl-tRNA(Asn)/glutamyl-tRNA(Gln) amidotransferase subunit B